MGVYEEHEMTAVHALWQKMQYEKQYRSDGRNAYGCKCGICGEKIESGESVSFRNGDWVHSDCLYDY